MKKSIFNLTFLIALISMVGCVPGLNTTSKLISNWGGDAEKYTSMDVPKFVLSKAVAESPNKDVLNGILDKVGKVSFFTNKTPDAKFSIREMNKLDKFVAKEGYKSAGETIEDSTGQPIKLGYKGSKSNVSEAVMMVRDDQDFTMTKIAGKGNLSIDNLKTLTKSLDLFDIVGK